MRYAALLVVAMLAGCAAAVTSTSPRSVTVNARMQDAQEAQDLATAECAKHGRHARLSARPGFGNPRQWAFDCVQ